MKLIYKTLAACSLATFALTSCSSDDPFSVAGPSDDPHILAPTFPDRVNGELPVIANINRDKNFAMDLTVTPADYVDVVWYLDGAEVATGKSIDLPLVAGSYQLKVTVTTTEGKSTYREGIVKVTPLDGDPYSEAVASERIIAPGQSAVIFGRNLSTVASVRIGDSEPISVQYSEADGTDMLSYTVPQSVIEGTSRLTLIAADGQEYGANQVTISSDALVVAGADRLTANGEATLDGINLDKIASLEIGGKTITTFSSKSANALTFTVPALEDGDYQFSGKMSNGNAVTFFVNNEVVSSKTVTVSSETTLWSGHHYVSWDLADGDPNKTFNLIGKEVFAGLKAGSVLTVHYSIEPSAEYHQLRTTTGWWTDLPGTATVEFSEAGATEVQLTQEALNMIQEQDGFLCVGHGYYVDLITVK